MTDVLATTCAGSRRGLFGLALWTGILTILTLGLYRFWAGARLRRWHWSAIRPGGHPLDHDGDAGDRIAGFLFAVAILALWVTAARLLDLVIRPGASHAGIAIGLALLVPVGFWARDRQRAATLSQTSWRGIPFGMAPGAAGHAWRACLHWGLTILSLGLLWPWMTFRLEKYRTDRTFFGTARFEQGGRALMLYPAFWPALVAAWACVAALALGQALDPRFFWLSVPLGAVLLAAGLRYRVLAMGIMASEKRLGGMRISARPSAARIGRIVAYGGLAILVLLALPVVAITLADIYLLPDGMLPRPRDLMPPDPVLPGPAGWAVIGSFLLLQGAVILICAALRHAMIIAPIRQHLAESIVIEGASTLANVGQHPGSAPGSAGDHSPGSTT